MEGEDNPALEADARGRASAVMDVLSLDVSAIARFYQFAKQETARAAWTDPMTVPLPPGLIETINQEINDDEKDDHQQAGRVHPG